MCNPEEMKCPECSGRGFTKSPFSDVEKCKNCEGCGVLPVYPVAIGYEAAYIVNDKLHSRPMLLIEKDVSDDGEM